MPKAAVIDMAGQQVGEIELSDAIFGIEPNEPVLHMAVKSYLANQRQGTQSTLTRAEVSGGGRKPWRQKGTGHARQGSTRSPQWVHGGIAFGPKPREYTLRLNKKVKRLAMKSALSSKFADGGIIVVDSLKADEIKTKTFAAFLKTVNAEKALIVTAEPNRNIILSARNIPSIKPVTACVLSPYEILKYTSFVVDKDAVARIEEVFA